MVLVQMFLTTNSQSVDLNLPAGYYKIRWVGANVLYDAAEVSRFSLSFRSSLTALKYGNVRYLQVANPQTQWYQIDGKKEWEYYYNGPFQMDVFDVGLNALVGATKFTTATLYFDIESIKPTTQFHLE